MWQACGHREQQIVWGKILRMELPEIFDRNGLNARFGPFDGVCTGIICEQGLVEERFGTFRGIGVSRRNARQRFSAVRLQNPPDATVDAR